MSTRTVVPFRRNGEEDAAFEVTRAKDPVTIVIFGASGDLSRRKLVPALYRQYEAGYLPDRFAVVGFSRTPMSDDQYREKMHGELKEHVGDTGIPKDHPVVRALHYSAGNADDPASFQQLKSRLQALDHEHDLPGNRLFYLSVAPRFFSVIINQLKDAGMIYPPGAKQWSRVIIEKPFGRDLESARTLNQEVTTVLDESQIFRIDHYLGKETVQNILSFRFGNAIFEPLFNHKYVSNVQLTVAEPLGMEGRRGHYYDSAGAIRDMVQNHMLQLLCLIAMEPPAVLDARSVRDEKVKVLHSLMPFKPEEVAARVVRAQYSSGEKDGQTVKGYLEEEGVASDSQTESYVAMRFEVNNWRWAGVPFLLRHGKRLRKKVTEIAVEFKRPPLHLFKQGPSDDYCLLSDRPVTNRLILRIQPEEGIRMSIACKQPGMKIQLEDVEMDFTYREAFAQRSPEAYERLILDAMRGDASLFTRSDEVDYAWQFITSILEGFQTDKAPKMVVYTPFSDGPKEAQRLIEGTGAYWRRLSDM